MTEATAAASPFDAIIDELAATGAAINKAQAEHAEAVAATDDDAAIAEAAGETAAGEDGSEGKKPGEVTGDDAPAELGKSFKVTMADGTEGEAVDATDLLKALVDRVELGEVKTVDALKGVVSLVKSQGELIKSLSDQVSTLANSGRKRASVVTVVEKNAPVVDPAAATVADGISVDEFWGKAFEAQAKGAINATDIAKIEFHINHGKQPPEDIMARITRALAAA